MSKLLYVQASPTEERSHSIAAADAFVEAYSQRDGVEVDKLNVFEESLPSFDGHVLAAKYAILHGQEHTEEQMAAWKAVEETIERFTAAELLVLASPMWNFGVPYRLKQYIDVLTQPGYTFKVDPQAGYVGLVTGRPAVVVSARGGAYEGESEAYDFQKPYLENILRFLGFEEVHHIVIEPTLAKGKEVGQARRAQAIAEARELAGRM